jgi:hypothetical protein
MQALRAATDEAYGGDTHHCVPQPCLHPVAADYAKVIELSFARPDVDDIAAAHANNGVVGW